MTVLCLLYACWLLLLLLLLLGGPPEGGVGVVLVVF